MANRYWVGAGSWTNTNTANWSATSGGAGGASVPTAADDVFFDANSGSCNHTYTNAPCNNLNFTNYTAVFSGAASLVCSGSLILGAGMTLSHTGEVFFRSSSATITTNGVTVTFAISTSNSVTSASLSLTDNLLSTNLVSVAYGTFSTNNYNVKCTILTGVRYVATGLKTINLGSSTITLTGSNTDVWIVNSSANTTINAGTSTIKITNNSTSSKTFAGGGKTYHNLELAHSGTGAVIISGSNTFSELKITNKPVVVRFTAGTTQTVSAFIADGTEGNLITMQSSSSSSWTISKSSGSVAVSYCSISRSIAAGAAKFIAYTVNGNVDGGNNTGWIFTIPAEDIQDVAQGSGDIADIQSYISALLSIAQGSDSVADIQNYIESLQSDIQSSDAVDDIKYFHETVQDTIASIATVHEAIAYIEAVQTVAQSASIVADVQTYADVLGVIVTSGVSVADSQGYADAIISVAQSAASAADKQAYIDTIADTVQSLASSEAVQMYCANIEALALSSASVADIQTYINEVLTTAQGTAEAVDALKVLLFLRLPCDTALARDFDDAATSRPHIDICTARTTSDIACARIFAEAVGDRDFIDDVAEAR